MQKVRIFKSEVTQRVDDNRDKHKTEYEAAMNVYRRKVVIELEHLIDSLNDGDNPDLYIKLPRPENHTDEYDVVLDMLNSSADDVVELNYEEFVRYMRDEWSWKKRVSSINSAYAVDVS